MAPPSSRMTKQPVNPGRYHPGKALVESESEEQSSSEEEQPPPPKKSAPKATSFPARKKPPPKKSDVDLEGFVTASESSEDEAKPAQANSSADQDGDKDEGSSSSEEETEEESEEEEDSSSDDEPKKPLLRPTFISKAKRAQQAPPTTTSLETQAEEEERRRKAKADEMLQAQLEREAAAKAAGRKAWDDDADVDPEDQIDDQDGVDPEAEHAAWKLRELKRVRRERLAIEEKEKEIEEIERRRNLTAEEREAEDRVKIEAQKEEREGKGKMAFMQKYHHKGAFFQGDEDMDEDVKAAMNRDFAGARFEDETGDKALLPEYMKMRDMTRLGKKGRTRYKDLKTEDTGRWGEVARKRRQEDGDLDERFRPDDDSRGSGSDRTGANNAPLGERRTGGESEAKRPRYD